ncbi:peptidoglycan-binding protein [Plantactinospora solaniradicis]|uniref:Peptidoglycan-binding protein n=1 Tax=Plantactinospora solaniradicis TaxID=1723736 RepID=A0ABW1KMD6_9ACTN
MSEPVATNRRSARRRRRGRAVAVVGAVVVVVGAAAVAAVGVGGGNPGTPTASDLPPGTAQVTRETMLDTDDAVGDLGYGAKTTLGGWIAGVVTKVPLAGDVLSRGRPIYRVDNAPVVLMYGAVAAYRTLDRDATGADVRQLETNLKALGYGGFTVDNRYTASTATAVRRWQKALGLTQTGQVELGRVLFAPGAIRVDTVTAGVNQPTGGGREVLQYTGTGRQVTVRVEVSKQRLARKGVAVQVQMPDGKTVAGRVERVHTVIEQATDPGSEAETLIEALVSLGDPTAAAGIEAASVTVVFTAAEREDVLTVPVAALVALAEGGYGVEVVEGSTTRYLKVETGLFANGRVEVTGGGLTEGMTVGTPQ